MRLRIILTLMLSLALMFGTGYAQTNGTKKTPQKTTQTGKKPAAKDKKSVKEVKAPKENKEKKTKKENAEPKVSKAKKKETVAKVREGQDTPELRAGLGFFSGFPLGDFNKDVYTGYGVNADGEYFLKPDLSVGLNTGFYSYKHDEIHIGKGHYTVIPIQLRGAYYFLDGGFRPFAGLNLGVFMTRSKYDSIIEPHTYIDWTTGLFIHAPGGVKPYEKKETVFGLAPFVGVAYRATEKLWLQVQGRYNLMMNKDFNRQVMGVQLGFTYTFGL